MAEQQLVDYIKKAKEAGQADDQTRSLLLKNGWSSEEVNDAFGTTGAASSAPAQANPVAQPKPQPQAQPQPQVQPQPQIQQYQPQYQPRQTQVSGQPEIKVQPNTEIKQAITQQRRQEMPSSGGGGGMILKILIVLILLGVIGAGGYFAWQTGFVVDLYNSFLPKTNPPATTETQNNQQQQQTQQNTTALQTKVVSVLAAEYDATKITVAAFSKSGDDVAFCAPLKSKPSQIHCFLNGQKLPNTYAYKPYWIGISPDDQRVIFLYNDSAKKQSFIYENGSEGARYNGTITFPAFSKDGKDFAFMVLATNGKNYVVVNNVSSPEHDKVLSVPKFSDDGKYILYGARDGQNISWVADLIQR